MVLGVDSWDKQEHNKDMDKLDLTVILSTMITATASIVGAYFAVKKSNHEKEVQDARREERYNARIDNVEKTVNRLEEKVDEHNGYAEKFAKNSESLAVLATKIEHIEKKVG